LLSNSLAKEDAKSINRKKRGRGKGNHADLMRVANDQQIEKWAKSCQRVEFGGAEWVQSKRRVGREKNNMLYRLSPMAKRFKRLGKGPRTEGKGRLYGGVILEIGLLRRLGKRKRR